jgi:putative hydrolase of the HAD superfamily
MSITRGYKAIIFDLGNVLVDFDHTIAADRISPFSDKPVPEIVNLFFDSSLTGLFEEGKISPEDFFIKVKEKLNLKLDYERFLPIWNEIFFISNKNQAMYGLAKSLKDKYTIALLSNINILHFNYLKEQFSVFDIFHHVIPSFAVGFIKPHPLIYEKALEKIGAQAEETVYTDDRTELIEKAENLGIKSFHFQNPDKLKNDFLSIGIKEYAI